LVSIAIWKIAVKVYVSEEVEWVRDAIRVNPNLNIIAIKQADMFCLQQKSPAISKNGNLSDLFNLKFNLICLIVFLCDKCYAFLNRNILKKSSAKTFIQRLLIDGILNEAINSFKITNY
jgi:hypothetical protein